MPTSYLMQMHSSYVVTDPKGTILVECGKSSSATPKLGKDGKKVMIWAKKLPKIKELQTEYARLRRKEKDLCRVPALP